METAPFCKLPLNLVEMVAACGERGMHDPVFFKAMSNLCEHVLALARARSLPLSLPPPPLFPSLSLPLPLSLLFFGPLCMREGGATGLICTWASLPWSNMHIVFCVLCPPASVDLIFTRDGGS